MYISTRDNYERVSAAQAIKLGMVPAGGLFIPEEIPQVSKQDIFEMAGCTYQQTAARIFAMYLPDYTAEEIQYCIDNAYNADNFSAPAITPLKQIGDNTYILELWYGPTAAFKDVALQIMPYFLVKAKEKLGADKETVILVATSGDTGKAALEGFKNVPGIKIIVFYPYQGVSKVQELQMSTTDGDNTYVAAVRGNFDDCQTAVKNIFADQQFNQQLAELGYEFSSANSINWGRLLPQIVYYFSAYLQLVQKGKITLGEKINFVVPTGNFGNILAGWYAYKMGLPVARFICASNENKILTDFFRTGVYDKRREFKKTMSPSMDILISSNLERFLCEICGHDGAQVTEWMKQLNSQGYFDIGEKYKKLISDIMIGAFATEEETLATIKNVFDENGYTLDTHTAVGVSVYKRYAAESGDKTITVIDSTANPFKFNASVLKAVAGEEALKDKDEFAMLDELSRITGQPVHRALAGLDEKPVRHTLVCEKTELQQEIEKILGI